jgi:hypothetical protein
MDKNERHELAFVFCCGKAGYPGRYVLGSLVNSGGLSFAKPYSLPGHSDFQQDEKLFATFIRSGLPCWIASLNQDMNWTSVVVKVRFILNYVRTTQW